MSVGYHPKLNGPTPTRGPPALLLYLRFFGACLPKAASTSSFLIRAPGLPRSSRFCSSVPSPIIPGLATSGCFLVLWGFLVLRGADFFATLLHVHVRKRGEWLTVRTPARASSVRIGWSPVFPKVTLVSQAANVEMDHGPFQTLSAGMFALGHSRKQMWPQVKAQV